VSSDQKKARVGQRRQQFAAREHFAGVHEPPRAAGSAEALALPTAPRLASTIHRSGERMIWHLEFYRVERSGKWVGPHRMTHASSIENAAKKAESLLRSNAFPFARANLCLIKNQDGDVIRQVTVDA
jgi:hypothetical protein